MGSQIAHILAQRCRFNVVAKNSAGGRRRANTGVGAVLVVLLIYFTVWPEIPRGPSNELLQTSQRNLGEIPPHIWQLYTFAHTKIDDFAPFTQSWITKNQDYAYTLMSNKGADAFAQKHYTDRTQILRPFLELRFPILRTDLLRYMILESEGGVYSDLDTGALKPIAEWVPEVWKSRVHAVVGIEYDQLNNEPYVGMKEKLQFCQWTIAASRGHPIMTRTVQDVVAKLRSTAEERQTSIADLKLTDDEVVNVSGPVIWTHVVMQTIPEATGTVVDYRNLTGMTEPRLFGDVLILPIDGFGTGQPHSNARTDEGGDSYVRHMWKGSWKDHWND